MAAQVRSIDIGCEPSPSIPAEVLVQDGWETFLLFFAVSKWREGKQMEDLGVAVLNCKGCSAASFGYPNDEGLNEHPLYTHGISDSESSILEVVESPWVSEMAARKLASARRIWANRQVNWEGEPDHSMRHFIIPLKEKTFECLASGLHVEKFCETYDDALAFVWQRFKTH